MLTHQFWRVIPPQAHKKSVYFGREVPPSLGGPRGQQPSCPGSHPQSVPHPPGARGREGLVQESETRSDQRAWVRALPGSSGGNLFPRGREAAGLPPECQAWGREGGAFPLRSAQEGRGDGTLSPRGRGCSPGEGPVLCLPLFPTHFTRRLCV